MSKIMMSVLILFLFCSTVHTLSAPGISPDRLIVEGQSIGNARIGAIESSITGLFGEPSKKTSIGGSDYVEYEDPRILVVYEATGKKDRRVREIYTHSPSYITGRGIRVGSPAGAVEKAYGKPAHVEKESGRDEYIYPKGAKASLRITMDRGRVYCIGVSDRDCWWRR